MVRLPLLFQCLVLQATVARSFLRQGLGCIPATGWLLWRPPCSRSTWQTDPAPAASLAPSKPFLPLQEDVVKTTTIHNAGPADRSTLSRVCVTPSSLQAGPQCAIKYQGSWGETNHQHRLLGNKKALCFLIHLMFKLVNKKCSILLFGTVVRAALPQP